MPSLVLGIWLPTGTAVYRLQIMTDLLVSFKDTNNWNLIIIATQDSKLCGNAEGLALSTLN